MGWLTAQARRGRRPELERIRVMGLSLLQAAVPLPEGLRPGSRQRRLNRAADALRRAGVRRVLTAESFEDWPLLSRWGLCPVDAVPLCQALAAPLALAVLTQRGTRPAEAVLSLRATRVSRPLFQAAEALCPQVRGLIIDVPAGGMELGEYLRGEYGVPLLEAGSPHLELQFAPVGPSAGPHLCLWGEQPELGGLTLLPPEGVMLPGVNPMLITALLWGEGHLSAEGIEIFPTNGRPIALDRTGQTTYNTKIM